ncbi:MAG: sigma-70 family RNA polymerase sigma factor [Spirochaetia bacterium]|nr:sigma-70 family RNA polymerase sigma factor [Spirochaetia bacterium]
MMNTEKIWNAFQYSLQIYVFRRVSHREDADDILQTIFEKIHKNQNRLNKIQNIQGWLFAIAKNTIIDYYRKKKEFEELPEVFTADDEEKDDKNSYLQCMYSLLETLPDKDRKILKTLLNGKSIQSLANETNISYSTLKSRAQRSKEKIRKKFISCCNVTSLNMNFEPASCREC